MQKPGLSKEDPGFVLVKGLSTVFQGALMFMGLA
jgi:hypothetical protein